jgi:mannose-6-phosphate isomerase-like protein (cupin superfamily)
MIIKDLAKTKKFVAGDKTIFKELFNPLKESIDCNYCLGEARLKKGKSSLWHRLKSTEVYFILEGTGLIEIGNEKKSVHRGTAIVVPASARQRIKNTGKKGLVFLCIVSPAWKKKDEKVLE